MYQIKATYAKTLVSKKDAKYHAPQYVILEENQGSNIVGFTYVIPQGGVPHYIDLCTGEEWDKCHYRLGNDKKCEHGKWHSPLCAHNSNLTNVCNCSWQNCK